MRSRKVLLAVRRSESRSNYERELWRNGFQVTTADNGLMCLVILRRDTPDVVVLEPELLWGGGDGVVAVLRDNPRTRSVPVLVLTTDASRSAVYRISRFPIADYLTQPVSPERLTGRVARLVLGDQLPLSAESPRHTLPDSVTRSSNTSGDWKSLTQARVS